MEFDEARVYQPGDDIRNIDWRVTARRGKAHTKLFREERERPVVLWVDFRPAMFFATRGRYKSVTAAEAASLLAWSANRHGDRVGALVFSEEVHHETKPQRGKAGVLNVIHRLVEHPAWEHAMTPAPTHKTLQHPIARLARVVRPGSLVFLISDFRGMNRPASMQLIRIARHSEVIMLLVYDPLEQRLPPPGRYRISDGRRERILDTRDRRFADDYARRFETRVTQLQELARRYRMFVLLCPTNGDLLSALQEGLLRRPK